MEPITHTFFTVSNRVSRISYDGEIYKPGDKIKIKNEDLEGFDKRWLIAEEIPKAKPTVTPKVITSEDKPLIEKPAPKTRGRKKTSH